MLYRSRGRLSITILRFFVVLFQSVMQFLLIEFKLYFVVLDHGTKKHPSLDPFVFIVCVSFVVLKYS